MNPVRSLTYYFLKLHFDIFLPAKSRPSSLSLSLSYRLSATTCYVVPISRKSITCLAHCFTPVVSAKQFKMENHYEIFSNFLRESNFLFFRTCTEESSS